MVWGEFPRKKAFPRSPTEFGNEIETDGPLGIVFQRRCSGHVGFNNLLLFFGDFILKD